METENPKLPSSQFITLPADVFQPNPRKTEILVKGFFLWGFRKKNKGSAGESSIEPIIQTNNLATFSRFNTHTEVRVQWSFIFSFFKLRSIYLYQRHTTVEMGHMLDECHGLTGCRGPRGLWNLPRTVDFLRLKGWVVFGLVQRDRDGGAGPAWGPTILRSLFVGDSIKSLERFGCKAPFQQVIPTDNSHSLGREKTNNALCFSEGVGVELGSVLLQVSVWMETLPLPGSLTWTWPPGTWDS